MFSELSKIKSSNYAFRNSLFGPKNDSFSPLKRPFEDEHPIFNSGIVDDDLFMNNEDSLGLIWSNDGSKNPSAHKVILFYLWMVKR